MGPLRVAGLVVAMLLVGGLHGAAAVADPTVDSTFDAHGVKIHYVVEGTGEPVVLIHGLHASAEINWRLPGVLTAIAKDQKVIALDLPGHGRSDKPDNEDAYGLALVEDVALLLDHLKIDKAHIVG
jgi:pimeloyl-ACP methyl ester carboxylesterase